MSITKCIVKSVIKLPKIEDYNNFLFIGPHPDDIEIGAGATAAKLVSMGKNVTFLIATDGRYGDGFMQDMTRDKIINTRKNESLKSAKILDVKDIRFLNLSDGGLYKRKDLLNGIAAIIGEVKPDIIFAPDPNAKNECHKDHLNVGQAVKQISYFAPYKGIMKDGYNASSSNIKAIAFYMSAHPNQFVKTTGFFNKQLDALFNCHTSQFPKGTNEAKSLETYLKLRAYEYGLRNFTKTAEGFRVICPENTHCLPEL